MATALRPVLFRRALLTTSPHTTPALPAFRRLPLHRSPFQTSAKRAILPPLPQVIKGTVNDAAPTHEPEPGHGSYHWTAERLVSAALIPITVAPFAAGALSPLLDGVFISMIIVHTFIGFQSIIADYLPKWRVPFWRRLCDWGNVLAVFVVGWGWYEFETNDVGLTEGVKRIWKSGSVIKT